jgi:hypothetical protein
MGSLNEAFVIESSGNIMTPKSRIMYPSLFEPTQVKGQGKAKFRLTLLLPAKSNIDVLREAVMACAKDALGSKLSTTKWRNPLIKVADEPRLSEVADDFKYLIRPNSDNRPQVVLPNKTVVDTSDAPDEVYGGRWGRASISVYWYSADKSPVPGVGLGLSNVQLLDHDDPLGGGRVAAESEFDEVDDKDLADMEG